MTTPKQQPVYEDFAPGWPGIAPRWTSSAKVGVGTALGNGSRTWFTLSHGNLNEVYYPHIDPACIRDLGRLIVGPDGLFSEVKRNAQHSRYTGHSIRLRHLVCRCPGAADGGRRGRFHLFLARQCALGRRRLQRNGRARAIGGVLDLAIGESLRSARGVVPGLDFTSALILARRFSARLEQGPAEDRAATQETPPVRQAHFPKASPRTPAC